MVSIHTTIVGGTPPYEYTWSNGDTDPSPINNLCKGDYTVMVIDANGCIVQSPVWTVEADDIVVANQQTADVTCGGGDDGSYSISILGGCPLYTFDSLAMVIRSSAKLVMLHLLACLPELTKSVSPILEMNQPIVVSFEIIEPEPMSVTIDQVDNATSGECNGAIYITPSGGTPPYDYEWSTGQISQDIEDLCPNPGRTVTLIDANGCVFTSEPIPVDEGLTVSADVTDVICLGDDNGTIDLDVSGGMPGYQYNWSDGDNTGFRTGLAPGTYTVTITDNGGNTVSATYDIDDPPSEITIAGTVTNATNGNANGAISLDIEGGWGVPYEIFWSNGFESPVIGGLFPGTYVVVVFDDRGCDATATFEVTNNELTVVVAGETGGGCGGSNLGSLSAEIIGGDGNYTYVWSNGAGNVPVIGGLATGIYTVTVTDGNGLVGVGSGTVEPFVPIVIEIVTNDEMGSAEAIVSGGTPPYTYQWNDANGSSDPTISNQPSGTYAVVVTDDEGCTSIAEAVLNPPGPCDRVKRVISPNDDGMNDIFTVVCAFRFNVVLEVYNRWGQQVYLNTAYTNDWNGIDKEGNPLPEGGYFYVIRYTDPDGTDQVVKGALTIVR